MSLKSKIGWFFLLTILFPIIEILAKIITQLFDSPKNNVYYNNLLKNDIFNLVFLYFVCAIVIFFSYYFFRLLLGSRLKISVISFFYILIYISILYLNGGVPDHFHLIFIAHILTISAFVYSLVRVITF